MPIYAFHTICMCVCKYIYILLYNEYTQYRLYTQCINHIKEFVMTWKDFSYYTEWKGKLKIIIFFLRRKIGRKKFLKHSPYREMLVVGGPGNEVYFALLLFYVWTVDLFYFYNMT